MSQSANMNKIIEQTNTNIFLGLYRNSITLSVLAQEGGKDLPALKRLPVSLYHGRTFDAR